MGTSITVITVIWEKMHFCPQTDFFPTGMNVPLKQRSPYPCIEYALFWHISIIDIYFWELLIYYPQRPSPCPVINNIMRDITAPVRELLSSFFPTLHALVLTWIAVEPWTEVMEIISIQLRSLFSEVMLTLLLIQLLFLLCENTDQ